MGGAVVARTFVRRDLRGGAQRRRQQRERAQDDARARHDERRRWARRRTRRASETADPTGRARSAVISFDRTDDEQKSNSGGVRRLPKGGARRV